ncbi:MAG: bacterial Ig-like domain-containing protein [Treponema sp.]|jgi:hypothetical protein|nr:bacterial Ig-like domain-containing protein [Treponema sp.]
MRSLQKTGFFLYMLVLSFMGCGPTIFVPDGELEGKALTSQGFSLILFPVHREYPEFSSFAKTEDHLTVFLVNKQGSTQKVPLAATKVTVEDTVLVDEEPYFFETPGEKTVTVSYKDLSAQYTIIVRSGTAGSGDPGSAPSGGTSIAIDIIWN